ncbi:hypothetical protein [Natrinema sp. HArc-T2]|uniref:hypothetical protein n=1 Tax=Natrinema sp. HArc-T2 TaxID=3242701 RepID=UPI00359D3224
MSDSQLHDRVHEILTEADTSSVSLVAGDGDDESTETDLLETATEASDLLESTNLDELLAAVGLDTLADGTEPDSIPEAIARGEQENVAALQRLLHLAKLADRADDGSLEGAVGDLQEAIDERTGSATEDEDRNADRDRLDDESATAESGDTDETDADHEDRLRSSLQSSFEQFGDDLQQLRARLGTASAGTSSRGAADDAQSDADDAETAGDEGLVESGLSSNQDYGTASGGPTRCSTMAPPPSRRADMKGPVRHSTVPDKQG